METSDFRSVFATLNSVKADEIYNLAGQTSVGMSFSFPVETFESILIGTMNLLECIRLLKKPVRFYNAGSSEVFGNTPKAANENTPYHPRSPYAAAKAAAHYALANYREAYGLFVCTGILFNHESPLRPSRFVTRKIVAAAVRIYLGSKEKLRLGNINIYRDWGWAPEYVEAMWKILQQPHAEDFVIATGKKHSLKEFISLTFSFLGLDWKKFTEFDKSLHRPADISISLGDAKKAQKKLRWSPQVEFEEIISTMIAAELNTLSKAR